MLTVYIYMYLVILMEIVFLSKSMLACALSFLSVEVKEKKGWTVTTLEYAFKLLRMATKTNKNCVANTQ